MSPPSVSTDGWAATQYNKNAAFVYSQEFTTPVLSMLGAKQGERIIDFGCGTGDLTQKIQELVGSEGFVVGVDSSANMVNDQAQNSAGITGDSHATGS